MGERAMRIWHLMQAKQRTLDIFSKLEVKSPLWFVFKISETNISTKGDTFCMITQVTYLLYTNWSIWLDIEERKVKESR